MSRKDYIVLSEAIRQAIREQRILAHDQTKLDERIAGIYGVIEAMAQRLELDNPRFDVSEFIKACEKGI